MKDPLRQINVLLGWPIMGNKYHSCEQCGEYRKPAMRKKVSNRCHNCSVTNHSRGHCTICRQHDLPIEHHHLAGKKHASRTIPVCLNCHAMLSHRQYQWPGLWRGDPCIGFLLIGFMDYCVLFTGPEMPLQILGEKSDQLTQDVVWKAIDTLILIAKLIPLAAILFLVIKVLRGSSLKPINGI